MKSYCNFSLKFQLNILIIISLVKLYLLHALLVASNKECFKFCKSNSSKQCTSQLKHALNLKQRLRKVLRDTFMEITMIMMDNKHDPNCSKRQQNTMTMEATFLPHFFAIQRATGITYFPLNLKLLNFYFDAFLVQTFNVGQK